MPEGQVTYFGRREGDTPIVEKQVDELPPAPLAVRLDLARHGDKGNWGYEGGGCRQLAVMLLADVLGDEFAVEFSQKFKQQFVARLPWEGFQITAESVEEFAKELERREREGK